MNAAAKFLNQGSLSRHWALAVFFTRAQAALSLALLLLFMSAFSIITVANTARALHANLYQARADYSRLYGQEGQLLLERSTLSMQARVQNTAQRHFKMVIPSNQAITMVHE